MKKIIAIISALVIAASMTACAADNGTNETAETTAATTAAETEAVTETTAEATEAETTTSEAEAAKEGAPKAEDDTVESIDDIFANRADGLWMVDLTNKANEWPNNVKINVSYDMSGVVTYMEIETLADKFVSTVEVADMMSSTQIFDGVNYYMVDGMKKTYCINPNGSEGVDNYMLADDAMECFVDAGIEEIDGTKYIYEEYNVMDVPTRYYFDEFGEVACYSIDVGGEVTYMNMTVEFADEADETAFVPPADCTELSYDDYINQYME